MRFGAAHHALSPPVLDDAPRCCRARPVVAVERAAGEIEIELRAIGGELLPQSVKYFQGQAAGIGRRF
jgi:hypothetical protein